MNSSSTCLMMLEYIKNKHVVVVTNNGKAVMVPRNPGVELILTGGEVYERKISMVGEVASKTLSRMTASKCFIGVGGISAQHGLTTSTLQETAINELMIKRCSGGCYVLADSSKLEEREVTLGRNDEAYIEVLSGLEEGETVFIQNASSANPWG